MRADQPVSAAAAPTVRSSGIAESLPRLCQGYALRRRRALAPVRDLEDRRVLERGHPVHRAGGVVERRSGADDLALQHRLPHLAELELRASRLDEPGLVLLP